jgi:transposase-like protein
MATCWIDGSQSRRNKKAAKRFFRKLLKGLQYVPRVIITDKLKSYGAAKREILPGVEHRQHSRAQQSSGKLPPTHATA